MNLKIITILISLLTSVSSPQNPHNWHYCGPLESPVNITALYLYGDSSIIAATDYHVMFVSHNNGATWDTLTDKLPGAHDGVKHLEMVNGVLYAGYLDQSPQGMWRSLDTGKTWEGVNYPGTIVYGFTWFGNYIFGSTSSVHRSADSGRTWESFTLPTNLPCMCLTHYGDTLYAGTYSGIFWSLDTGKTWVELIPGETTSYYTADFIGNILFVGTEFDVAISQDFGFNWNIMLQGNCRSYKFDDSLIYAKTGLPYYCSKDSGKTWVDFRQYDSTGKQMYFDRIWTNRDYYFINGWGIYRQKRKDSTFSKNLQKKYIKSNENILVRKIYNSNIIVITAKDIYSTKIFSPDGKLIRSAQKLDPDKDNTVLNVTDLPPGIYIISINQNHAIYNKKIVIKR